LSDIGSHDEFLALCALATANQLTTEEQKRLQEHLVGCRTCREASRQYDIIVDHVIPGFAEREATGNVEPGPAWSPNRAEEALFKRIANEDGSRTARTKPAIRVERSNGTAQPYAFRSQAT